MSFEQILIFVFVVLLPLIQLFRDAIEKKQQGGRQGPPQVPSHKPVPVPIHLPAEVNILPEALQRGIPGTAPAPAPEVRAPAAPRPRFHRPAIAVLRSPAQLRQAILLFTILGPCRAIIPHGTPDSAGRE